MSTISRRSFLKMTCAAVAAAALAGCVPVTRKTAAPAIGELSVEPYNLSASGGTYTLYIKLENSGSAPVTVSQSDFALVCGGESCVPARLAPNGESFELAARESCTVSLTFACEAAPEKFTFTHGGKTLYYTIEGQTLNLGGVIAPQAAQN